MCFGERSVNVWIGTGRKNIPDPSSSEDWNDIIDRNPSSVFLTAVKEEEIIDIVNKCKPKTSTDCKILDVKIVKKVIEGISEPLIYIGNLSFQSGKFPDKMRIV